MCLLTPFSVSPILPSSTLITKKASSLLFFSTNLSRKHKNMSTSNTRHAETEHPPLTTNAAAGRERIRRHRHLRRLKRSSMARCSSETTTDGSFRLSDTSEDEYHSGFHADKEEVDLESGELEMSKANNDKEEEEDEKDCRICHLSLMENGIGDDLNGEGRIGIELGCACKGDLGNAHKQCAETWFKIKGNITCEICGAIAINVAEDKAPDLSSANAAAPPANVVFPERQTYCHGRRIMNFLLACMIFAFVISWLFHFDVLR